MKTCIFCGKRIEKNAKTCEYCGKKQPSEGILFTVILTLLLVLLLTFGVRKVSEIKRQKEDTTFSIIDEVGVIDLNKNITIRAKLKNNTDKTYNNVVIKYDFFDENKELIDFKTSTIKEIKNYEEIEFEIEINIKNFKEGYYKFDKVTYDK